jgi:uncharacterized protein (TIGR04255 family)
MARERHLSKAPIREAVLDLRFPLSESVGLPVLRESLEALDDFREMHELRPGSATFRFSLEGGAQGSVEQGDAVGFRATTEDGLWVAQYRLDGLTFSRLHPYPHGDEFYRRGRRYVESLMTVARPTRVDRVALRYINHFRLPHPGSMDEYFVGLPSYPEPIPQFVSNLLTRATVHDPERDFTAHITHSLLDDLDPERMGFILDIDAFRTTEFAPDVAQIGETFEALRVFKNKIFFGLITEANAELHE